MSAPKQRSGGTYRSAREQRRSTRVLESKADRGKPAKTKRLFPAPKAQPYPCSSRRIIDSDDSSGEDLIDTMDRDIEELYEEERITKEDLDFIDDSQQTNVTGLYTSLDTEDEDIMSIDNDIVLDSFDELREVRHETPPSDSLAVVSGTLRGFPCTTVYSGEENGYLIDETFINKDKHEVFVENGICTVLTGPMGCGKTTLMQAVTEEHINGGGKVLYVSCNRTLCRQTARNMKLQSYLDLNIEHAIKSKNLPSMVICINSLPKLLLDQAYCDFTLVIFDEIVGIIDMLLGALIKPRDRVKIIKMMAYLVDPGTTKKRTCIVADALVSDRELMFLSDIAKLDANQVNVWRFFPKKLTEKLSEIVYIENKNEWMKMMLYHMKDPAQRIFFCAAPKEHSYDFLYLLKQGDTDILSTLQLDLNEYSEVANQEWFCIDRDTDPVVVQHLLADDTILNDYPRFLYTPAIQSGVSFSRCTNYNVGFGLGGTFFAPTTFAQMLRRPRNVTSVVPGQRAKIYVHIIGEQTDWSEPSDIEHCEQLIDGYATLSKAKAKLLQDMMGLGHVRQRNVITDYFVREKNKDVIRLMAYYLQSMIKFRQNKKECFRTVIKMNDPNWPWSEITTENKREPITAKFCKALLRATADEWATGEMQTKSTVIMTQDTEKTIASLQSYYALGNKQVNELAIKQKEALFPLAGIEEVMVLRARFTISPFAFVAQNMFVGSDSDSHSYIAHTDVYNIGCAFRELVEVLAPVWRHHHYTVVASGDDENQRRDYTIASFDLENLDEMALDTRDAIVAYWKPLVRWKVKHDYTLFSNSVDSISGLKSEDTVPTAEQVTGMRNLIVAFFGLLGIKFPLTDAYLVNYPNRKPTRKRQTLGGILHSLHQQCSGNDISNYPNTASGVSVNVTLARHLMDEKTFYRRYDMVLRRDLTELITSNDPERYLYNRFSGDTDFDSKAMLGFFKQLRKMDRGKVDVYLNSASHWVLEEPDATESLNILKEFNKYLMEFLFSRWERLKDLRVECFQATYCLSETTDDDE